MHRATLLGIGSLLSLLPLVLPLFMIVRIALGGGSLGSAGGAAFIALYLIGFAALVAMVVVFAVDAFRSHAVSEGWQAAWLVLFILAGVVAVPVYWWRHVRGREA